MIEGNAFFLHTRMLARGVLEFPVFSAVFQACSQSRDTNPELPAGRGSPTSDGSSDINWENLCDQDTSLGLIHLTQPCNYYAHGIDLTQA
jgi:hypothetical protein